MRDINLKDIAKQWKSVSTNWFNTNYNDIKIVDKKDLVKLSKIKIDSDEILVMAIKRTSKPDILQQILEKLKEIETRLSNLENRLTLIVQANNLIDPTIQNQNR